MDREAIYRAIEEHADEIYIRLRSYIRRMTAVRGLPPGIGSPDEIINEAIMRLLSGTREWDPDKHSILTVAYGTVRSLLSKKKGLYAREGNKPLGKIADGVEPAAEDDAGSEPLPPEEADLRWQAVKAVIEGDRDLLDYVEAIRLGIEKPAEIAEAMGIPVERVYEIPRKLQKLAPTIHEKLRQLEER